jgi:Lon protease-like protein
MSLPVLPIFPVPCVVFPFEVVNFHIFEERFRAMLGDCLKKDDEKLSTEEMLKNPTKYTYDFGVTCFNKEASYTIGCAVAITKILATYNDGSVDISVEGLRRYTTKEITSTFPYPCAQIEFFDDISTTSDTSKSLEAIALYSRLHEIADGNPPRLVFEEYKPISFFIAHHIGLELDQRQTLLESTSESQRLDILIKHLIALIPKAERSKAIRDLIAKNGHVKHLPSFLNPNQ